MILVALFGDFKIYATSLMNSTEDMEEGLSIEEVQQVVNSNKPMQILAKSAVVYDRKYQKILYEKNIDEKIPNASTTKILTAIVAYENANMDDVVIVSAKAAGVGGSTIGLKKENKVVLGDLMKGLLICSGNDAATAIAEHVGGSVEDFCNMMNEKAIDLGATGTHFVTPHGLDNDEHYTTVRDLMMFSDYLLNIPYLAEIVNMRTATIKIDNYLKELRTTNEMLGIYEEANGIKTGYTSKAGRCLVTSITRNGRQLITIVLGCDTKKQRTKDTIELINYGYSNFEEVNIYKDIRKNIEIEVEKANCSKHELVITGNKIMLLKNGESEKITYQYEIKKEFTAPLQQNEKIGEIFVLIENEVIDMVELRVPTEIRRKNVLEYMLELIEDKMVNIELKI